MAGGPRSSLQVPEDWVPVLLGKKLPKTWGGVVDALSQRLVVPQDVVRAPAPRS